MIEAGMVYRRDASWHSSASDGAYAYHWPSTAKPGLSACGKSVLLHDEPWKPEETHPEQRCKRSGCAQRWKAWLREPDEGSPE